MVIYTRFVYVFLYNTKMFNLFKSKDQIAQEKKEHDELEARRKEERKKKELEEKAREARFHELIKPYVPHPDGLGSQEVVNLPEWYDKARKYRSRGKFKELDGVIYGERRDTISDIIGRGRIHLFVIHRQDDSFVFEATAYDSMYYEDGGRPIYENARIYRDIQSICETYIRDCEKILSERKEKEQMAKQLNKYMKITDQLITIMMEEDAQERVKQLRAIKAKSNSAPAGSS